MAVFDPLSIPNVSDYLSPNTGSGAGRLPVFGGESFGFARGITEQFAKSFYSNKTKPEPVTVPRGSTGELPRSTFNQFALFNYSGFYGNAATDNSASYRDDNPASRSFLGKSVGAQNLTIPKIIEFYNSTYPNIGYKAQDFLYSKWYRKIPLNHLITLRRMPMPCEDNIFKLDIALAQGKDGKVPLNVSGNADTVDATQVAGVTAVTYMGETAGNKLSELMSMTYGLNWKELESKMEEAESGGGYTSQPMSKTFGALGGAVADVAKGISPGRKYALENSTTADKLASTYADFVIGPVNVIDRTTIRDRGLKFEQDMKLVFEYELKSLSYVNPKVAMIDIISNMLTMTTNNASFWGGGQRYYGAAGYVASQFGDVNLLKQGNFAGYTKSLTSDVTAGLKNIFGNSSGGFDLKSGAAGVLNVGKQLLGNKLGELLGSIAGDVGSTTAQRTFISAEPTGNWHVTIGNPLNPIATMGNMYCDNTIMTLGDGLGYDDFPLEVKFEITLKHGKPRDKGNIENMFNAGRGRIYASAASENDILNLAGVDAQTYGSVRAGNNNFQPTQSGTTPISAPASSVSSSAVGNINSSGQGKGGITKSGEYISNLVSLIVDS